MYRRRPRISLVPLFDFNSIAGKEFLKLHRSLTTARSTRLSFHPYVRSPPTSKNSHGHIKSVVRMGRCDERGSVGLSRRLPPTIQNCGLCIMDFDSVFSEWRNTDGRVLPTLEGVRGNSFSCRVESIPVNN